MRFDDYDLVTLAQPRNGVYDLAAYTIRQIAEAFGVILSGRPSADALRQLIAAVGPKETLQDNIEHVRSVLGPNAVNIAASWLENSGVMNAVAGAFSAPAMELATRFDATVIVGGVANWQLRRMMSLLRIDPARAGQVVWACGNRVMGLGEHQLVATYNRVDGNRPTEAQFADRFIIPNLEDALFHVTLLSVDSKSGDEVCAAAAKAVRGTLDGTVLVVGNAPNTIQSAGQFRAAARAIDASFDDQGSQLYMVGDPFMIAKHGESKDYYQNPLSGLGQLVRDAYFLQQAIEG